MLGGWGPGRIGLRWGCGAWLAEHEGTIDAMRVESSAMMAHDAFIVKGAFDASELAARLSATHNTFIGDLVASAFGTARNVLRSATDALRPEYASHVRDGKDPG